MPTYSHGIDVSYAQGAIDWEQVITQKDFAIIRAGYGQNNIDDTAHYNCSECNRLGFPIGLYWFSYAYTVEMAHSEAEYVCQFAANYDLSLAIFFDFEYDSEDYAESHGVTVTPALLQSMMLEFCSVVESYGYETGVYYNADYYTRFRLEEVFYTDGNIQRWVAQWSSVAPDNYYIWQYGVGAAGSVAGISTTIDLDTMTSEPPLPPPTPGTSTKMPIWFYLKNPLK